MSGRMRLSWMILAVLFAALAGFACVYAGLFGTVYNQPGGDPAVTVETFFESVRRGYFQNAYACLSDYSSLGLETEPETEEAKLLYEALRNSYSYLLISDSEESGLEATQMVRFRALNIGRTEAAIAALVNEILEEQVEALPASEVYAEDGSYLPGLTDLIYRTALERVLQNPDPLCAQTDLTIHLQYLNGQWLINADRELQQALIGGEG